MAYVVGGYVDVDPQALPANTPRGRLMGYDGAAAFVTLCRLEQPLWAVFGAGGAVYAVGDQGLFVRYDPVAQACTTQTIDTFDPGMAPRLRAITSANADATEVLVGGTSAAGAPVVYAFDGTTFRREQLPAAVTDRGINGMSFVPGVGVWAVGSGGLALRRDSVTQAWSVDGTLPAGYQQPLWAVSTETQSPRRWSMAVGGNSRAAVIARSIEIPTWTVRPDAIVGSGRELRGVYASNNYEVYMVGLQGTTVVFNGVEYYEPPRRFTSTDLLAVSGRGALTLAVGGTLSDRTAAQRGVLMVRGFDRAAYTVDGVSFPSAGRIRLEFGGGASSQ